MKTNRGLLKMINYAKQSINAEDIKAVVDVLKSEYLTTGPTVPLFEEQLVKCCGAKYCTVVTNATSALHIALLAMDVSKNDIVWTTPISFAATANAALYVGAEVGFIDIDPDTFNLSATALEKKLSETPKSKYPKVIIIVHLGGNPAQMREIHSLCEQHNIKIIEDASHALGSKYGEHQVGSCEYSEITVFSFHAIKMITTGEGGAALTNSSSLHKKLMLLRSHGITRAHNNIEHKNHPWYYEQVSLGYNYRMSDIQAALGISQLNRLEKFLKKRNYIVQEYKKQLKNTGLTPQFIQKNNFSSYHLFLVNFPTYQQRDNTFNKLEQEGIKCNLHYIPIYRFPFYKRKYGDLSNSFPVSENYFKSAMTLPLYTELKWSKIKVITDIIKTECSSHENNNEN